MSSHKECCDLMKDAVDEENIKQISEYQNSDYNGEWYKEKTKIKKGYYIIDGYCDGELCLEDYPAKPQIPLNFCPWCGTDLVREWKTIP